MPRNSEQTVCQTRPWRLDLSQVVESMQLMAMVLLVDAGISVINLQACLPKPTVQVCFGAAGEPHPSYSSVYGWPVACVLLFG